MAKYLTTILVTLILAGSALGGTGTVTLKNGKEYKGVTYTVDTTEVVLVIEQSGWIQKIPPERIERVVDNEGLDVTASILAALKFMPSTESPQPQPAPPSTPPTVKPAVPGTAETPAFSEPPRRSRRHRLGKPFDVAIGGRANFSIPFGDYYEGITSGVGFEGDIRIQLSREMALMFLVSKSGMKAESGYNPGIYPIWPFVLDRFDISMSAMRYYVGLVQTGRAGTRANNPDLWYVYFALGAVAHRGKATLYVHDANTSQQYIFAGEPTTDTRFGNLFGGGYIIRFSKTIGLDLSGSFEGVWTRAYYSDGTETVAMKGFSVDFKAGLTMVLGR